jgi:hypothetical protein
MPGGRAGVVAAPPAAAAGGWEPTDLSGLQLWLDASDLTTFSYSSGVVVSEWRDKSGNAQHVGHSDTGRQPSRNGTAVNGVTTVNFDGSNDHLFKATFTTIPQPYTMVVVGRRKAGGSGTQDLIRTSGGAGVVMRLYQSSTQRLLYAGTVRTISPAFSTSNPVTWVAGFDGASSTSHVNGASESVGGSVGTESMSGRIDIAGNHYGGIEYACFQYAEVLIYNSRVQGADLTALHDYLSDKWATF